MFGFIDREMVVIKSVSGFGTLYIYINKYGERERVGKVIDD